MANDKLDEPDGGDVKHGITAKGIVMIVGAVFLGLTQLMQMYLTWERENRHLERSAVIAAKVEQVAVKQSETAEEHSDAIASLKRTIVKSLPSSEAHADSPDK